jgi:hypothetical protein
MAVVVYDGPFTGVVLPDGRLFEKGKPVEVEDDLAESLCRQDFTMKIEKGKGA